MRAIFVILGALVMVSAAKDPEAVPGEPAAKGQGAGLADLAMKAKLNRTVSNLRQLGIALFEFEADYGAYPDDETGKVVKDKASSKLTLSGTTSNDYFRQLLAAGLVQDETIFQIGNPAKKADNVFTSDATALAPGECDVAFLVGGSTEGSPARPLAVIPLVAGTLKFDPIALGGKAVILRNDNSVITLPISAEGDLMIEGKTLFNPAQKFWGGKKPIVAWPKPSPAGEPAKPVAAPTLEEAMKAVSDQKVVLRLTKTANTLRQIGMALFEFESEYGSFPDEATAKTVTENTKSKLTLSGTTSNDYFRQLMVAGIVQNEEMFQFGNPAKKADNVFNSDATALVAGECDFAYLVGGSSAGDSKRPLAVAPLVPGTLKFDPVPLGGKALVLAIDCSVKAFPISPEGEVVVDGKSLFDPSQPYWGGKKPVVAWPKQ